MTATRKAWYFSISLLVFCGVLVPTARTIADLDLWGHVLWGMHIASTRQVPQADPFSYLTQGQPWINHEWLGDLNLGLAWLAGDAPGLLLLKLVAWLLVYGVLFSWLRRNGLDALRGGLVLLCGVPILSTFSVTIRPQMFTALCFTLLLWSLQKADAGQRRWLWALPGLFWLWANLHGGFLVGLGMLWLWAGVSWLTKQSSLPPQKILPSLILSGLVTCVNPYGVGLWRFLLEHLLEARPEISEWQPLAVASSQGLLYLAWLGLSILGLVFSRQPKKTGMGIILGLSALLPLVSVRHLLFFQLAALMVAGPHLGHVLEALLPTPHPMRPVSWWLAPVPGLVGLLLLLAKPPNLSSIPLPEDFTPPARAVALLAQTGASGNIAVDYDWGHYVSWHLNPIFLVSVDTRREMAYPAAEYEANLHFMTGYGDWDELLRKYPTDLVLIRPGSPPANLMALVPDWELVFQDAACLLFARRDSTLAQKIRAAGQFLDASDARTFP